MSVLLFLVSAVFVAWAQNATVPLTPATTPNASARPANTTLMAPSQNASEATSELRQLGKEVAESSAFAAVTLVVTILLLVREYFNNLFEIAEGFPRFIGLAYLLGGWFFAILMALLALIVSPNDGVTVTRMSLLFASASLAFGPFYVFSPTRPIKLQKQTFLKRLATVARKKESRWTTFVIFCLLTALQGVVAYDLYALLTSIAVPFEQVALTVFGYVLLTLFYLIVFYTTMLGRVFQYNDLDVVEHIRKNAFVEFRRRLHLLSGKKYAYFYVALFLIAVALQLVVVGVAIKDALDDNYFAGLSLTQLALFVVFAIALLLLLLVSISFVLVSAFRPVPIQLGGKAQGKDVEAALAAFSREEREIIALHLSKSHFETEEPFSVFAARISPPIRALIDSVARDLLHLNTREPTSKQVDSVGTAHLRMLEGTARAVVTTSDDVEGESVDQWLAFFVQRDAEAQADGDFDPAARRRVLFYTLAHAFLTPATWAKLFEDVADDVEAKERAADVAPGGSAGGAEMRKRKTAAAAAASSEEAGDDNSSSYALDEDGSEEEEEAEEAPPERARSKKKAAAKDDDDIDLEANKSSVATNRLEGENLLSLKSDMADMSEMADMKKSAPAREMKKPAPAKDKASAAPKPAAPLAVNKHAKSKHAAESADDAGPSPPPPMAAPMAAPPGGKGAGPSPASGGASARDQGPSPPPPMAAPMGAPPAAMGGQSAGPSPASGGASARDQGPSPPPPPAMSSTRQSSLASPASPRAGDSPSLSTAMSTQATQASMSTISSPEIDSGPMPPPPMATSSAASATASPPSKLVTTALSRRTAAAQAPQSSAISPRAEGSSPMPPPPMAAPMAAPSPAPKASNAAASAPKRSIKSSLAPPSRGGGGGGALLLKEKSKATPMKSAEREKAPKEEREEESKQAFDEERSLMSLQSQSSIAADDEPAPTLALAPMQRALGQTTFGELDDDASAFAELSAPTVSLPVGFDGDSASDFTWVACTSARTAIDGVAVVATKVSRIVDLPLSALRHANLVQLHAYANEDFDKPVLALWVAPDVPPLSVARSLEAMIAVADVVRIILQLARALHHLHANDVLHGAISPDTVVMVEPSDGGATVALLSDYVGGDERVPPALYAAPERSEPYTPRTREADVFSLGAVLQWALASQSASSATLQRRPGIQNLARQMTDENPQARPSLAAVIEKLQALSS